MWRDIPDALQTEHVDTAQRHHGFRLSLIDGYHSLTGSADSRSIPRHGGWCSKLLVQPRVACFHHHESSDHCKRVLCACRDGRHHTKYDKRQSTSIMAACIEYCSCLWRCGIMQHSGLRGPQVRAEDCAQLTVQSMNKTRCNQPAQHAVIALTAAASTCLRVFLGPGRLEPISANGVEQRFRKRQPRSYILEQQ